MIKNAKFSGYYCDNQLEYIERIQICISVPLNRR